MSFDPQTFGEEPKDTLPRRFAPLSDEQRSVLRDLLAKDKLIEAIKLHRDLTGASLAESKHAVEALAEGSSVGEQPDGLTADWHEEIRGKLVAGEKIEAIKLYRQRTGAGLADAKRAVEEIANRHGIATKSGCAGSLLLLAGLAAGAVCLAISTAN